CRTPWCDAPIRHADHVTGHAAGGPTTAGNGQGLCEACNYTKQAPGWRAREHPDSGPGDHLVETTTPTGHTYPSRPPPLPGHGSGHRVGQVDLLYEDFEHAA
ncbi:MAG: HNH endonuclease, partial [Actinomycetes bacterium]